MKLLSLIVTSLSLFTTACSTTQYIEPNNGATASVSFSNLSLGSARVSIIHDCKQSDVDQTLIVSKDPSEKPHFNLKVPANKKLTVSLDYFWFSDKNNKLISNYNVFSFNNVRPKLSSDLIRCSQSITFTPDKNKNYDVYFGLTNNNCGINASEIQYNDTIGKSKLLEVNKARTPQC